MNGASLLFVTFTVASVPLIMLLQAFVHELGHVAAICLSAPLAGYPLHQLPDITALGLVHGRTSAPFYGYLASHSSEPAIQVLIRFNAVSGFVAVLLCCGLLWLLSVSLQAAGGPQMARNVREYRVFFAVIWLGSLLVSLLAGSDLGYFWRPESFHYQP